MKARYIMMAAMLAIVASCNESIGIQTSQSQGEMVTIRAVQSGGDDATRTSLVEGGSVWWNPGDDLSVFYGSGANGGSRFTADISEPAAIANFTGIIDVVTGGGEISMDETWFWATYPYNADASCDGSSIVTELPDSQIGKVGTFSDNTFITVAKSRGLLMSFYNVCSGLKFSVTNPEVEQVRIKSNGGEPIAGKVRISFDASGVPYVSEVLDGTDEIVVSAPDGGFFEVGQNYYITMLPQTLASGFTVTFETWYEQASREITQKATFKRAVFNTMASADANVTYTAKPYAKFEDPDFEAYCISNFDSDGDGLISRAEALAVIKIDVSSGIQDGTVTSLKGIGVFENLQLLNCYGTYNNYGVLTSLDVSRNSALTRLSCHYNQLASLDVSKNTALEHLRCSGNQLTSLDVSNNTKLIDLECYSNQLTSLDVSNNTALTYLKCYSNQLTSLDVSKNTALTTLYCYNNQLTSLDVSNNTKLIDLECHYNQLASLDVSNNTKLIDLRCYCNQLTSLDVSKNTALEHLNCSYNQLASLDVSKNTALEYLNCSYNQLTSLDVSKNTALTTFYCYNNQLTSLDVSKNTALTWLNCSDNQLASLDVSKNTALINLDCSNNQFASLDVSKNTALIILYCEYNEFASLDVSKNTALTTLHCYNNQLTSLDVSNNTALTYLKCYSNQLTSLDVSKNIALEDLSCYSNPLSYLYIYQGQSIPNITVNRSASYIPSQTTILVGSSAGGNEGTGEGTSF